MKLSQPAGMVRLHRYAVRGKSANRGVLFALAVIAAVCVSTHICLAETPVNWDHIIVDPSPGSDTLEKALADVKGHGDGKLDIIIGYDTYTGPGGVYWYEYPSSGNPHDPWIKHTILSSGGCYEHMQVFDLNGDGRPDIILSINSSIKWLEHPGGDGTGTWIVHDITGGIGHEVRLADIDGDGKMDVVTSRTRNVDFQDSPVNWTIVPWGQTESGTEGDGLGLLDIGSGLGAVNIVGATSDGIFWFENPREHGGNARTDPWIPHRIGNNYGPDSGPSIACVDVNRDGRVDIITAPNEGTAGNGGLMWWEAPADPRNGTWIPHVIDGSYEDVHWIEIADVNNDGIPDLIVTEEEQSAQKRVAVFYGDGQGNFLQQVLETTGGQNQVAGDVNADGRIDFISVNHGVYGQPNPVELFVNLGPQTVGSGGSLTGNLGNAAAGYNLTALGTSDWADWGGEGNFGNFDHKASGGGQISNVNLVGAGGNYGYWSDASRTTSWSDGTPNGSSSNNGYIWSNGALNSGFTFTVPADTNTRTLSIYCGASTATATLTAHLSDSSAPDYVQSFTGPGSMLYTITYNGGSANQTLTLTLLKTGNNPGFTDGSADLKAAWLVVSASSLSDVSLVNPPAASATAPASIDLGSVKVNKSFKLKLPLPATISSQGKPHATASGLPPGTRISGDLLGGVPKKTGSYTITVHFTEKVVTRSGKKRIATSVQETQEYTLSVTQ